MINNKEFEKVQLDGLRSMFIKIPESIILNKIINDKRISVFSYLYCKTTMDYKILFSIQSICNWLGKKINKHKNRNTITSKIIDTINYFNNEGIVSFSDELSLTTFVEAEFDKDNFANIFNNERFAKIYIDELNMILDYKNINSKDTKLDNSIVLLVFAYLRMKIPIRNNLAGASHRPEAFDNYYKDIGEEIGVSERIVSRAVSALIDLGLIYVRQRDSVPYVDNNGKKKFVVQTTIFCNTYKRLKGKDGKVYLIDSGKDYYLTEINEKEKELEQYKKRKYR